MCVEVGCPPVSAAAACAGRAPAALLQVGLLADELTLQSTQIKLAVSPQPRVPGEPVTTTIGAQLAVKVEGIVQVVAIRSSSLVEI